MPLLMTGRALRHAVIVLVEKSLGLHRQVHLVLECRILAVREQRRVIGNRFEKRFDPGTIILGEVGQDVSVNNTLQTWVTWAEPIAGMTYSQPHTAIFIANMRRDRT